ncbi:MAG: type II toxin-antitoxin system RelE/ParE family toxin [Holosporales bacterium]
MTQSITVHTTSYFTRRVKKLFDNAMVRELEQYLAQFPHAGVVIPGLGGVRKWRVALGNKGKSGGARVIYYYHAPGQAVYLLTAYAKNTADDLSPAEKKLLKDFVLTIQEKTNAP